MKVWLLRACLLATCAACAASGEPHRGPEAQPRIAQAESVLATLRDAHAGADAASARGDYDAAEQFLKPWLAPARLSTLPVDRRSELARDLWFRIAHLSLLAKRPERALAQAEEGLAFDTHEDPSAANLHLVAGRAAEQLGQDERAAAAYHQALLIHDRQLERLLEERD